MQKELISWLAEIGYSVGHVTGTEAPPVERPATSHEHRQPRTAGYQLIQHGRQLNVAALINVKVVENEKQRLVAARQPMAEPAHITCSSWINITSTWALIASTLFLDSDYTVLKIFIIICYQHCSATANLHYILKLFYQKPNSLFPVQIA